jgi:aminoglycoside phosphotransferase (APT) family kinase protein
VLDGLPRGDRLCHGDFHLGNLLGSWHRAVVIDWGYAARGDPLGDVAQCLMLHLLGAMPPGIGAFFTSVAKVGRVLLTQRYLAAYRRQEHAVPFAQDRLDRWYLVHLAARLGEPVEEEHPAVLAELQARVGRIAAA